MVRLVAITVVAVPDAVLVVFRRFCSAETAAAEVAPEELEEPGDLEGVDELMELIELDETAVRRLTAAAVSPDEQNVSMCVKVHDDKVDKPKTQER